MYKLPPSHLTIHPHPILTISKVPLALIKLLPHIIAETDAIIIDLQIIIIEVLYELYIEWVENHYLIVALVNISVVSRKSKT